MPRESCAVFRVTLMPLPKKIGNDTERSRNARGIEEMGYDPLLKYASIIA